MHWALNDVMEVFSLETLNDFYHDIQFNRKFNLTDNPDSILNDPIGNVLILLII